MATETNRDLGLASASPTRHLRRFGLAMLIAMVAACGGGGEAADPGGPAPAQLTTITVSPATASVNVGLAQTVAAVAKDQNGNVMPGVSFSWASSNNGIASVSAGVATGLAAGTATITASSGGVTSNAASITVVAVAIGRVAISQSSIFFSAGGQTATLSAQLFDPLGAPSAGIVTWTSSAPDKVSVDAAGQLVALAVGSAQIFAQAGSVRSAPTLVIVALPQAGALLVTDAQVVSVGPPLRLAAGAAPGVGTEYEVTLQGVAAPAPGTIVIGVETAPVAGKVVSTRQEAAGLVVTLALAPLYQLFRDYDIRLTIELADFAFEPVPARSAVTAQTLVWSGGQIGKVRALASKRGLEAFEPFKALKCDTSVKAQLLGEPPINLKLDNKLKLVVEDRPGYSKRVLEGSLAIVGSAGVKLQADFKAEGTCNAQGKLDVPITGVLKAIVVPAVRIGLGVELKAEFRVVEAELGVDGTVGFSGALGWECGRVSPACTGLNTITPLRELETKSKMPTVNGMKALGSAHFYVVAGLDASILLGTINASIVEARIGPKQSFDLAFEEDQAALRDYASFYDLKLEGVIEPGAALKEAIKMVIDDDAVGVKLEATFQADLSESPKGTLSVSKARVGPGGEVDFTVELDPKTVNYFLLNYNVVSVELYRKGKDEANFKPWRAMSLPVDGQTTFRYQWKPEVVDAGEYEFAALVNTKLPTPWLEIAKDTIQPVEVTCSSAGALSASTASRATIQAARAKGTQVKPLANACFGTWNGTSNVVVKTPGLPGVNIASNANITWTYDPILSVNGATYYSASGSFDLAFNSVDGCTFALSPSNFTIVNDPTPDPNDPTPPPTVGQGRLGIFNDGFNTLSYGFGGIQHVTTTMTRSCPGKADVVSQLTGFPVGYATGSGPFAIGQVNLSGSTDDAAGASTWNFNSQ